MPITAADQKFLEMLRKQGILHDVEGHRLNQDNGITIVSCADGDQMVNLFAYVCEMQKAFRQEARPHMLSLNGGALCLHPESPLNDKNPKGAVLLEDIQGARILKGIDTLCIYAHFPCGAARLKHMSAEEVFDWLVKGKIYLKEQLTGVKVACFVHVDWGGGRKRTYHFSAASWNERDQSLGRLFSEYLSTPSPGDSSLHVCGEDCNCT